MPTATANGKKFTFPEGTTPEQMGQAIDEYFSSQPAANQPVLHPDVPTEADLQAADSAPISQPREKSFLQKAADIPLEIMAGVNRGAAQTADFFTTDQVNAILQLAGSDKRVPSINQMFSPATQGNFMDDGLAKDFARAGGEMGFAVAPMMAPQKAQQAFSATNTAAQQLVKQGDDVGVPLLTSDVRAPTTFAGKVAQQTAEKIPIAGTGPVRQAQQVMRQRAVDNVAQKYGEFSYDAIINSLKTQKDKIKNAAGAVLQKTGSTLDDVGTVNTKATVDAINKAKVELTKKGVIKSSDALDDLVKLTDALTEPQTFTTLKENRTAFREIVKSTDKADRSQLTSRAKSLLDDVYSAMTKDMDDFARTNLDPSDYGKWKNANTVYANEANKLTRTKLKNVLDKGDMTPESVKQMLFSQNPSEQKLLYQSLTNEGRQHARAAIISKVVDNVSKRQPGFTPNSFSTELKKYGPQIDTFFKGKEKTQLEGLGRVLEATRRAQDAAITTPTGQSLIGGLSATGLILDPVATLGTAGTIGGLSRLYESAPVRNALLRLGSTPKSSPQYSEALLSGFLALQIATSEDAAQAADTEPPQQ